MLLESCASGGGRKGKEEDAKTEESKSLPILAVATLQLSRVLPLPLSLPLLPAPTAPGASTGALRIMSAIKLAPTKTIYDS